MRAVGSAEIFSRGAERGFLCATGRLDGHRRSSSTHPSGPRFHPIAALILRKVCGGAATPS
jgi:hypothetical protein